MKSAILRAAVLATATIGMLGLAISPAQAAMTSSVSGINQCDSGGSCGSAIKTDGTGMAHGTIQITAHEGSGLLDPSPQWVRVQARNDSTSAFTCLAQWSTTSKDFSASTKWDTSSIPNQGPGCPSGGAGGLTNNGTLQVQVLSHNANGANAASSVVTIKLNNAPTPPEWAASPSVSGAAQRAPVVTLKWHASPEPDVQEYRFFRTESGSTKQYPVSASNPVSG